MSAILRTFLHPLADMKDKHSVLEDIVALDEVVQKPVKSYPSNDKIPPPHCLDLFAHSFLKYCFGRFVSPRRYGASITQRIIVGCMQAFGHNECTPRYRRR